MRDFSLWPLQATLLHRCYKALSHRRRLQQALAAVCHWKDTNLTPYSSSQIQLGFQVFGKDFIQEQQRMACLLDAYSEKLPTQCFFFGQKRSCAKPAELSQQPMRNDMERQRRKRLAQRRAIFSLYQQVGTYEKLIPVVRYDRAVVFVVSFLPSTLFKIPQKSKGKRVRKC